MKPAVIFALLFLVLALLSFALYLLLPHVLAFLLGTSVDNVRCSNTPSNYTGYPENEGCGDSPHARCLVGSLRLLCPEARAMLGAFTMLCLFMSALLAVYHLLFGKKPKEAAAP